MDETRDHEPGQRPDRLFSPPVRLGDLRRRRASEEELRAALGRAAVEAAAEGGYFELTVDRIIERAGISRTLFYRVYRDREDCYASGYEELARILAAHLLGSCREAGGWRPGLLRALEELADFMVVRPLLANGLIAQVRSAGEAVIGVHDELAASFVAALDRARAEAPGISPPQSAGSFLFAAIESAAAHALARGAPEEFAARLPDLAYLATVTYLGKGAARG
jgi:AcrR family transcriptional regulator